MDTNTLKKQMGIIITGVGGQGVILCSDIIAEAALMSGYDVKQAEVHGMSQRGGSVISHVKFGSKVFSPLVEKGFCDLIIALEELEGLRYMNYLKKNGKIVVNRMKINPLSVLAGKEKYPEDIDEVLSSHGAIFIDGIEIARKAGNQRAVNIVLLGAASRYIPFDENAWIRAIEKRFHEKYRESNILAFKMGKEIN